MRTRLQLLALLLALAAGGARAAPSGAPSKCAEKGLQGSCKRVLGGFVG